MSLIDQAIAIIERERDDPPSDKRWFLVQIKRFEKAVDRFDFIASDNRPSRSSYERDTHNDAYEAKKKMYNAIEEWESLYGHLA